MQRLQPPTSVRHTSALNETTDKNQHLLCVVTPGIPDGLKVDTSGRIYSSSQSAVQVFSSSGDLLGQILVSGVANFSFGGPDSDTIYMMADTAIWSAKIAVQGATRPA